MNIPNIPKILYHGSTFDNLKTLRPKRTLSKSTYIGDYVFATGDKKLAIMYTIPKGYAAIMNNDPDDSYLVINSTSEFYINNDVPVFIYKTSGARFKMTPQLELEKYEFVATEEVEASLLESYTTSMEALSRNGIKVYFTDDKTFAHLVTSKQDKNVLNQLKPYAFTI